MSVASSIRQALPLPSLDAPINVVRTAYDRMSKLPGGKRVFSRLIGHAAPYTGTIGAQVVELRAGFCQMTLADRRAVRNHLNSVHAIALVNLAEVTGNLALSYSMPDDARFIVAGLSIEYVKKARGTILAECECPIPETSAQQEYEVPVQLYNPEGDLVARAMLRSLVGPKPTKSTKG